MISREKQVTCFELSQELKILGFPQDTEWYWVVDLQTQKKYLVDESGKLVYEHQIDFKIYSAPTPAELGEVLPEYFRVYKFKRNDGKGYGFACDNDITEDQWDEDELTQLMKTDLYKKYRYEEGDTITNVMAKMVISLLKDGLIKTGDLR